jgi:hypothetical protein
MPVPQMNVSMGAVALANPEPAPAPVHHPAPMQSVAEVPHAPVRAPLPFTAPQTPSRQPRAGGGLFAEPPADPATAAQPTGPTRDDISRPTLFSRMTGRLRRQPEGAPQAQPELQQQQPQQQRRTEPTMQPEPRVEPVRAAVRPAGNEEMGILDIPTFLRRQSS